MGLAKKFNIILVATIHQPSSIVYNQFGQLLLLSRGRPAYYGQANNAVEELRKITATESWDEFFDNDYAEQLAYMKQEDTLTEEAKQQELAAKQALEKQQALDKQALENWSVSKIQAEKAREAVATATSESAVAEAALKEAAMTKLKEAEVESKAAQSKEAECVEQKDAESAKLVEAHTKWDEAQTAVNEAVASKKAIDSINASRNQNCPHTDGCTCEFKLKEGWSDAEYLLDVINADFFSEIEGKTSEQAQKYTVQKVDTVLDAAKAKLKQQIDAKYFEPPEANKINCCKYFVDGNGDPAPKDGNNYCVKLPERAIKTASFGSQYKVLLVRQFLLSFRNPAYFLVRFFATIFFNTIVNFIFWEFHSQNQHDAQKWVWLIAIMLFVSGGFTMSTVIVHFFNLQILAQEMKNGMVNKSAYFLVTVQIMFASALFQALATTLPAYILFGLHWGSWMPVVCLLWICLTIYDLTTFCCAFSSTDRENGFYVALMSYNIIFGGVCFRRLYFVFTTICGGLSGL